MRDGIEAGTGETGTGSTAKPRKPGDAERHAPNHYFTTPNPILEGVELREAYARVREAADAYRKFVAAREAMNAAIPNPMTATPAEYALYDERYKADDAAHREHNRTAILLAQSAEALTKATPLIGLSQGEARKWLGDVVAAMVAARYQPGDHPIVPTKIAAFIDKAEEMLPRVLSALSGLSLPGRDAETRVTPEQNEALHKALLASGTPVAPPISGDDAVDRDTVIAAIHATLPNLDAQAVGRVADNVMPLFALSTVQDGSVREGGSVRAEIERQCSIGAGECTYDTETGLLSVHADLDIGTLERRFSVVSPEAFERAPKHHYWMAGDPNCPADIKAGNGELHTMRCKICELDNPRNPICHADALFARAEAALSTLPQSPAPISGDAS